MQKIKHYAFKEQDLIGEGSTGKVYLGYDTKFNTKVAIKAIQMSQIKNEVLQYLLQNEKKALQQIQSQYVLKLIDIVQTEQFSYIITEFCQGGTLYQYIKQRNVLQQQQAISILRKLTIGLSSIADKNFIHRDLKAANIMIRQGEPVIIDFGYCQHILAKKPQRKYNVGSPAYMAPECYMKSIYSEKSDIWSLGIIYHQMLTGEALDEQTPIKQYFKNLYANGIYLSHQFSLNSLKILSATLKINMSQRVNCAQLLNKINQILFKKTNKKRRTQSSQSINFNIINKSGQSSANKIKQKIIKLGEKNRTLHSSSAQKDKIDSKSTEKIKTKEHVIDNPDNQPKKVQKILKEKRNSLKDNNLQFKQLALLLKQANEKLTTMKRQISQQKLRLDSQNLKNPQEKEQKSNQLSKESHQNKTKIEVTTSFLPFNRKRRNLSGDIPSFEGNFIKEPLSATIIKKEDLKEKFKFKNIRNDLPQNLISAKIITNQRQFNLSNEGKIDQTFKLSKHRYTKSFNDTGHKKNLEQPQIIMVPSNTNISNQLYQQQVYKPKSNNFLDGFVPKLGKQKVFFNTNEYSIPQKHPQNILVHRFSKSEYKPFFFEKKVYTK